MRIIWDAWRVLRGLCVVILFETQESLSRHRGGSLRERIGAGQSSECRICAFDPETGLPMAEFGATTWIRWSFPVNSSRQHDPCRRTYESRKMGR